MNTNTFELQPAPPTPLDTLERLRKLAAVAWCMNGVRKNAFDYRGRIIGYTSNPNFVGP